MIQINYRDPRPIYEQVKEGFRKLILSGVLQEGAGLPSVRELAGELAINPNTIQRSYRELEAEGFIYTVAGRGSLVAGVRELAAERREKLLESLGETARELRSLGAGQEELAEILKEVYADD